MKKLLKKIKACFAAIFSRETISKVWEILFGGVKTSIGELLSDPKLMDEAFEISKSFFSSSATAEEKRALFDGEFADWAREEGYEIGKAALNAIRETAYAAVKAEAEDQAR